jgi:hypothetical protein
MKSLRVSWLLWSVLLFFVLVGAPRPAASMMAPPSIVWYGYTNDWFDGNNWSYFNGSNWISYFSAPGYSNNVMINIVYPNGYIPVSPVIGTSGPASANNLTVSNNTLTLADSANLSLAGYLEVGYNGTLTLGSSANVSLPGNLYFDAGSTFNSGSGATITLTGSDVYINSSNVNMGNTTLSFTNPISDTLDVWVANFTLGTLTLADGATVTLAGNNSVTVTNLDLEGNSILYLNNDTITVGTVTGTGQTLPGVPLPGSAWLLLSGLGGLAGWRRLRKS